MEPDELARTLADDVPGGFERVVLALGDRLYAFALHLSGNRADADEIAQETFIRAYRALERYPSERIRALRLKAWLFQIAVNVQRNRVRGRALETVPLDLSAAGPRDDADGPERFAEARETREALRQLVIALPARYRVAVVLRHVEGLGYREIAVLLGQPVGTVKSNAHRGVELLRAALGLPAPGREGARSPAPWAPSRGDESAWERGSGAARRERNSSATPRQ